MLRIASPMPVSTAENGVIFKFTPTSIGWTNAVGVSYGLPLNGNRFRGGEGIGDNVNSVGYVMTVAGGGTNAARYGPNQGVTGRITYALGHHDRRSRSIWIATLGSFGSRPT